MSDLRTAFDAETAETRISERFERRVTVMVLACALLAPLLALIAP